MRLFLAIELAEDVRRHLCNVANALRPLIARAGWTRPENLHLTIKFLGEVTDAKAAEVAVALRELADVKSFELRADRLVLFPPRGPVRIVAAEFCGERERLLTMYHRVKSLCEKMGFARECRPFHAHATLARPKSATGRESLFTAAQSHWPGPVQTVSKLTLMQSHLSGAGPTYIPLATVVFVGHK